MTLTLQIPVAVCTSHSGISNVNWVDSKFPELTLLMEKRQMEYNFKESLRKQAQCTTLDRVREAMKIHFM